MDILYVQEVFSHFIQQVTTYNGSRRFGRSVSSVYRVQIQAHPASSHPGETSQYVPLAPPSYPLLLFPSLSEILVTMGFKLYIGHSIEHWTRILKGRANTYRMSKKYSGKVRYCMSRKSCPILYSSLLYKMGKDFGHTVQQLKCVTPS